MSPDILFDNILIADSIEAAEKWAADSFDKKRQKLATESVCIKISVIVERLNINCVKNSLWGRIMRKINYKPKTWAVYIIYCCIPIFIYGWYLWKCVTEVRKKLGSLSNVHLHYYLLIVAF